MNTNLGVTDNDLPEPLLLYDQIVAGEVTVAATVCSEHRFIVAQPVPDLGLWRPLGNNVIEKSSTS